MLLLGQFDTEIDTMSNKVATMDKVSDSLKEKQLRIDANRALINNRLETLRQGRQIIETLCQTEIEHIIDIP